MMMSKKYILVSLLAGMIMGVANSAMASPFGVDTLQREMVLERAYQPEVQKAEKAFFNPLPATATKALKPIQFARNTYPIAMNLVPSLFGPLDNPQAPEPVNQSLHARLVGGMPILGGANVGFMTGVGDRGSLELSLDHLTRYVKGTKSEYALRTLDQTHDTEFSAAYDHSLDNRSLRAEVELFHHANTFYSLFSPSKEPANATALEAYYPLYQMSGAQLKLSLSPAPLSMASKWQYSLDALVGFATKEDVSTLYEANPVVQILNETVINKNKVSELSVDLGGTIAYQFGGGDWGFGASGRYQLISIPALHSLQVTPSPLQRLSVAPYVSYTTPRLIARAGAAVQLYNRGANKLLVVPNVRVQFRAHDLFSLYFVADGGAKYQRLREMYAENRWVEAQSVYNGFDVAKYRLLLGMELGNFNGFSINVQGGFTQYSHFSDWSYQFLNTELTSPEKTRQLHLFTPIFVKSDRGAAQQVFFNAEAHYFSSIGLGLAAKFQLNKYVAVKEREELPLGFGMPTANLNLTADYRLMDKLTLAVDFEALMGIKYYVPVANALTQQMTVGEEVDSYNCIDLGARVSYEVNEYLGLSLIGQNLLHQKQGRWLGYSRPGATGMLAVTLKF